MAETRLTIAPVAQAQARAIDAWWTANRPAAPTLFSDEFAAAIEQLKSYPRSGAEYAHPDLADVRRLLLRATRYHVYYRITGAGLRILSIWSALRGRGPDLTGIE